MGGWEPLRRSAQHAGWPRQGRLTAGRASGCIRQSAVHSAIRSAALDHVRPLCPCRRQHGNPVPLLKKKSSCRPPVVEPLLAGGGIKVLWQLHTPRLRRRLGLHICGSRAAAAVGRAGRPPHCAPVRLPADVQGTPTYAVITHRLHTCTRAAESKAQSGAPHRVLQCWPQHTAAASAAAAGHAPAARTPACRAGPAAPRRPGRSAAAGREGSSRPLAAGP